MNRRETEARVREINWPSPSPELRERVLSIAVAAVPRIRWSDRVWFSRGWRLSALAAALVVAAVDRVPSTLQPATAHPLPYAAAQAQAIDAVAQQVGLPADVAASLASRALSAASRSRRLDQAGQAALQNFQLDMAGVIR